MKRVFSIVSLVWLLAVSVYPYSFRPDEGMYPLSDISGINLKSAGLKIAPKDIYNPGGISLIDALVKLGGCTGSFVSHDGLILTNHHCSFSFVQKASTIEKNYLENGFTSMTREEEIPAEGLTCRITESYLDVSAEILKAADSAKDPLERMDLINNKIKEIITREEKLNPDIKAEVSEMFKGEKYVLFRYKNILDVRLVYAPPRSIGEFGGESDNWVWPRHTGDFSFLRAYVGPDGKPAAYSKGNIPYSPKKYLQINASGVNENDFVFILGYPGTTFRNQPSQYIEFQKEFQLPYIAGFYRWLIDYYLNEGAKDPVFALAISSKIKALANTMKNYEGKIQGVERTGLIQNMKNEEDGLYQFIASSKELSEKYGSLQNNINAVYKDVFDNGRVTMFLGQLSRNVSLYRLAEMLIDRVDNGGKDNIKDAEELFSQYRFNDDINILKKLFSDALTYNEFRNLDFITELKKKTNDGKFLSSYIDELTVTVLSNKDKYFECYKSLCIDENDPFMKFVREIKKAEAVNRQEAKTREGKLNIYQGQLFEVKRHYEKKNFIPDANSTLRLTYGYIKGYSPADAVYYSPFTSLKGVVEKGKQSGDYKIYSKLVELYNKKDFGKYKSDKLNDVPVALLYNTDTSGGNSGSPVMNAYGELIGLNFDRTFEATINDYAWSPDYSRSIGVDIRYILWNIDKLGGAQNLLNEMGVK